MRGSRGHRRLAFVAAAGLALSGAVGVVAGRADAGGLRGLLRPAPSASDTASPEPGALCRPHKHHLSYHGGALITHPSIFVLFWGPIWGTDAEHEASAARLRSFLEHVGTSEYACTWREYSLASQTFGTAVYVGDEIVPGDPPTQDGELSDDAIRSLILSEIDAGRAPAATDDTLYVVAPPKGVPVNGDGDTGCGGSNFKLCAYHDSFVRLPPTSEKFRYVVLPYPCPGCFVEATEDPGRALEEIVSHELSEAATDPDGPPVGDSGWFDDHGGDEVADICTNSCDVAFPLSDGTHIVNSLWSNLGASCVSAAHCETPPPDCTGDLPGDCVVNMRSPEGCDFEWHVEPNLSRRQGLVSNVVTCADGQPFCDADGLRDGVCTFRVAGCLGSQDPRLACSASAVSDVTLGSPRLASRLANDRAAASALLDALATADGSSVGAIDQSLVTYVPAAATPNACTDYVNVTVPVRGNGAKAKAGKLVLSALAHAAEGPVSNSVTLNCTPDWP